MNATVVTGASRGLGLGIAHRLAASGRPVVMAARDAATLEAAAHEVGGFAVPTDVTSPTEVQRLIATALERYGEIDALVNNAASEYVVDPPSEWAFEPDGRLVEHTWRTMATS